MPLKHLQHMQHPPIYFYNIKINQLQHTSETSETRETYICNIGEGRPGQSFPTVGVGANGEPRLRAPPAPATLVDALGSAREDLRRHNTCAPAAMAGSAVHPTAMGDGRMTRERAAHVTRTQVSGAGSEGTRHGRDGGRAWRDSPTRARWEKRADG